MKTFLLRSILLLTPFGLIIKSYSQAGTLDSTFGVNGTVHDNVSGLLPSIINDFVLQDDNKIIACIAEETFHVRRFLTNGVIDATFGINGTASIGTAADYNVCKAIAIAPDKKIVIAGYVYSNSGNSRIRVARLFSNGKIDSSFSSDGLLDTRINHGAGAYTMIIQPDGKIVVGGFAIVNNNYKDFALVRYQTDGDLDSTFGTNGITITHPTNGFGNAYINSIQLTDNGKIVVAGTGAMWLTETGFVLARYNSNGQLDSTFGENGMIPPHFLEGTIPNILKIQPDGKLLAGGGIYTFFIARYTPNGSIDSSFGTYGKVYTKLTNSSCELHDIALLKDGNFIAGGYTEQLAPNYIDLALAKYKANGSLDSSFGIEGKVIQDLYGKSDVMNAIEFQNDGKIIAAGYTDKDLTVSEYAISRFNYDEPITISLVKDISVIEGNSGTTTAQFKIALNKPSTTDVVVQFFTKDVTATSSSDYYSSSGQAGIKAGKTKGTIALNIIIGDNVKEKTERFALILRSPVNAAIGAVDSVTCAIKNDDASFTNTSSTSQDIRTHKNKFQIYPNPVHDVLNLQGLSIDNKSEISILDMSGKRVARKTVDKSILSWNINTLPNGNYLLQIIANKQTQTIPFLKQ